MATQKFRLRISGRVPQHNATVDGEQVKKHPLTDHHLYLDGAYSTSAAQPYRVPLTHNLFVSMLAFITKERLITDVNPQRRDDRLFLYLSNSATIKDDGQWSEWEAWHRLGSPGEILTFPDTLDMVAAGTYIHTLVSNFSDKGKPVISCYIVGELRDVV